MASVIVPRANGVPTEIWAEIIDHALWDDILFSINPLESRYAFHTALREWNSWHRARRFEVRCGILRLVSTAWKCLVDRSPYQHFGPPVFRDSTNHLERASNARRLLLSPSCPNCGSIWDDLISECRKCYSKIKFQKWLTLDKLMERGTRAEILDITVWDLEYLFLKMGTNFLASLSHLQAITIRGSLDDIAFLASHCTQLVMLTLPAHPLRGDLRSICFENLAVLRLVALGGHLNTSWLKGWSLPSLQHLEIEWNLQQSLASVPPLSLVLLRAHENGVKALHHDAIDDIVSPWEYIFLFQKNLVYQATVPLSDVWKTFVEETNNQYARAIGHIDGALFGVAPSLRRHLKSARLIKTYGLHSWEDMPIEFVDYDAIASLDHSPSCKGGWNCWMCIAEFHDWCSANELGCEDRDGQTFQEFSERRRIGARAPSP